VTGKNQSSMLANVSIARYVSGVSTGGTWGMAPKFGLASRLALPPRSKHNGCFLCHSSTVRPAAAASIHQLFQIPTKFCSMIKTNYSSLVASQRQSLFMLSLIALFCENTVNYVSIAKLLHNKPLKSLPHHVYVGPNTPPPTFVVLETRLRCGAFIVHVNAGDGYRRKQNIS